MSKIKSEWAKMAVDKAKKNTGPAWNTLLSDELREALVARELVLIALVQAEETMDKNPALKKLVEAAREGFAQVSKDWE